MRRPTSWPTCSGASGSTMPPTFWERRWSSRGGASPTADEGADVRDAIARLDPDLAELVRLVHWERLTLVQAAELLGIPDSTARGRYARAKEELRVALGIGVEV